MNIVSASDFEIDILSAAHAPQRTFIFGPRCASATMATRDEGNLFARQLSHCCSQPTRFEMRLAGGDHVSISRWGEWILLALDGTRMFLLPVQAELLSVAILNAWAEKTEPLAA